MKITIQIVKSLVVEAVKNATYLKGRMDASLQPNTEKASFNETAGDEAVHERTLTLDFQTGLEMLKTIFVDYIAPTAQTIGDNIIYYSASTGEGNTDEAVTFTLDVSRRFNGTLTDALARLSAKYVEDYMLYQWWVKTTNLKQAEPYQATLVADEQNIRRCFVMCAPYVPTYKYPETLTCKVDGEGIGGEVELEIGSDYTVSYSFGADLNVVDDIEAHSEDPSVVEILRGVDRRTFVLHPVNTGIANIRLFSRHSDTLKVTFDAIVTEEEGYE